MSFRTLLKKRLVIENGVIAIFVFLLLVAGGVWAAFNLPGDTPALTKQVGELKRSVETLTKERNEAVANAKASSNQRDDAVNTANALRFERDKLQQRVNEAQQPRDDPRLGQAQNDLSQLMQAYQKQKSDLDAAIAERDQLRRAAAAVPPSRPNTASTVVGPVPWKGPRCSEETRGKSCPPEAPSYGHEAPCGDGEEKFFFIAKTPEKWPQISEMRFWCRPK